MNADTLKCMCGHIYRMHLDIGHVRCYGTTPYDNGVYEHACSCASFQLDNLDYVERVATERNLI